jgi:hypothetical protein
MIDIAAGASTAAFLAATNGYGRWFGRWAYGRSDAGYGPAFNCALGMAVLALLGGLLNVATLAHGTALDLLLLLGILIWAVEMARAKPRIAIKAAWRSIVAEPAWWVAIIAVGFSIWFTMPTVSQNGHDDYNGYLLRPLYMLARGTLGGNWFETAGADSLGAQSFFQAFFLNHLAPSYADLFDMVIALGLLCALTIEIGRVVAAGRLARVIAVLALVLMDPIHVNLSANYAQALIMLTLLAATMQFAELGENGRAIRLRAIVPLGLLAALVVNLKFTMALFTSIVLALVVIAVLLALPKRWQVRRSRLFAALALILATATLSSLPWLALYAPEYAAARAISVADAQSRSDSYISFQHWIELVSKYLDVSAAQYGTMYLVFTFGFVVVALGTAAAMMTAWHRRDAAALALILFGSAAVLSFIAFPLVLPFNIWRYSMPMLFSTLPVALFFIARRRAGTWIALLLVLLIGAGFGPRLILRVEGAVHFHNFLVFGNGAGNYDSSVEAYSETNRNFVRGLQGLIAPGETFLVMMATPFQLDFARNPIFTMHSNSLAAPWIGDISAEDPAGIRDMLRRRGVVTVIWQRGGSRWVLTPADMAPYIDSKLTMWHRIAHNFLAVHAAFEALSQTEPVLYKDDNYVVFRLD